MIHISCGEYTVECDSCGETITADAFVDLIPDSKSKGWKVTRVGEGWKHYCPLCAEKMKPTASSDFSEIK